MKTIFISQPMNGKTDVEVLEARARAAREAQEYLGDEVNILDTFWSDSGRNPLQLLGNAISLMARADLVYFCEGWETARGCKIEHDAAIAYGINVLEA